jgi:hypothetical protein
VNDHIDPVRIVVAQAGGSAGAWLLALLIAAGVVLAIGAFVAWTRWRCRRDPLITAFESMSRGLAIPKAEREDLLALAATSGVPAAVLLVSESARSSAALVPSRARLNSAA